MYELADIREYVEKMTNIIATVVDVAVIICDKKMRIIGDAEHKGVPCEEFELLSQRSISYHCMTTNKMIHYHNAQKENEGCRTCKKRKKCSTRTIIAIPLSIDDKIIGSIAVYSDNDFKNTDIGINEKPFYDFLGSVAELIILKLRDKSREVENRTIRHNMAEMINTIPFPIVTVDQYGNMKEYNSYFRRFATVGLSKGISNLHALLISMGEKKLAEFCNNPTKRKEQTFAITRNKKNIEYDVSVIPTLIDNNCTGSLLFFQNTSDVYAKATKLYSNVSALSFDTIIGISSLIKKVKEDAKIFAKSSSTVLIQGESGTGKELFASAIHCESNYSQGPFVAVNCAAIPDNLMESELFGYVEGAFTGASKGGKIGKFELANGGTLFLDEIAELPIYLQPKLLRILQEKQVQRIGSNIVTDIDVRIIAATNKDLEEMIENKEFRDDLYYRLSVIPIKIPALRARKSDIKPLSEYFINMYSEMLGKTNISFGKDVQKVFYEFDWPGNIRELQNAIEYAINRSNNQIITLDDLPLKMQKGKQKNENYLPISLKEIEKKAIVNGLQHYYGDNNAKEKVAEDLGISRATLYRKIKEL